MSQAPTGEHPLQSSEIADRIKAKFADVALEETTPSAAATVIVPKAKLLEVARFLKDGELAFDTLHCLTAVDRKDKIEVVYILYSIGKHHCVWLKVFLPMDDLKVESVTSVWRAADWFEREVYDLFGVQFQNHPDLRRIMNPESWSVYPLRKDFASPDFIKKP